MATIRVPYPADPERRRDLFERAVAKLARFGTCEGTPDAGAFRGSTPIGAFAGSYRSEPGSDVAGDHADAEALARPDLADRGRGPEADGADLNRTDGVTSDVDHEHRAQPAGRPPRPPGRDRGARRAPTGSTSTRPSSRCSTTTSSPRSPPWAGSPPATRTGGSAWSTSSSPRATATGSRRSTRWSSTTTPATPTSCGATSGSTRSSSWPTSTGITTSSRITSGSAGPTAR